MTARPLSAGSHAPDIAFPRCSLYVATLDVTLPLPPWSRAEEPLAYQWSCCVETRSGLVDQYGFVDTRGLDPERELIETLLALMEPSGSILVRSSRETLVLRRLQLRFPDLAESIGRVVGRVLEIDRLGATGIHRVVCDDGCGILDRARLGGPDTFGDPIHELCDGRSAQAAYLELIDPRTPRDRRRSLAHALILHGEVQTSALARTIPTKSDGPSAGSRPGH
jgi:hypothetical protein